MQWSFTVSQPTVRLVRPRSRFPKFTRWLLQRLGELLWRLVPPTVFKILEPQVDWEAVSKWLFNRRVMSQEALVAF